DILVFDADLIHAGSLNHLGSRRRTLLVAYFAAPLYALPDPWTDDSARPQAQQPAAAPEREGTPRSASGSQVV
ncbi:hypothetical protein R0G64_31385, partial [Pseudomonas otitidis]|nr:hypothetical protein [Pseudomonas otitidis]